jgi:hypothetical protein
MLKQNFNFASFETVCYREGLGPLVEKIYDSFARSAIVFRMHYERTSVFEVSRFLKKGRSINSVIKIQDYGASIDPLSVSKYFDSL